MFFGVLLICVWALASVSALFFPSLVLLDGTWQSIIDNAVEIILILVLAWQSWKNKKAILESKSKSDVLHSGLEMIQSENEYLREEIKKILKR